MSAKYTSIAEGMKAAGVDRAVRHLFLCLGPECCPLEEGARTWDYLKKRCAELELPLMRTKAACLRVCVEGPWLVVYPEGVWYPRVTVQRCEEILSRHIMGGKPILEWTAKIHPLPKPDQDVSLG